MAGAPGSKGWDSEVVARLDRLNARFDGLMPRLVAATFGSSVAVAGLALGA